MLDGLGMAETMPGPLIQVVQFVGFMGAYRNAGGMDPVLAGILGSILTTWVTFVPCFLFIFVGALWIEHLRGNKALTAALSGITAAVVGVVLNLSVWFSLHVLFAEVGEVDFLGARLTAVWTSALRATVMRPEKAAPSDATRNGPARSRTVPPHPDEATRRIQ
jgi:chromate transporter